MEFKSQEEEMLGLASKLFGEAKEKLAQAEYILGGNGWPMTAERIGQIRIDLDKYVGEILEDAQKVEAPR